MVLASTQFTSRDKENLLVKTFASWGKHDLNTRRHRFRLRHTGFSHAPHEAVRRSRNPKSGTARTILVTGDGPTDSPVVNAGPVTAMGQRIISLPRYLQRPAYRDINSALSTLDSDLNGVPIEYIRQKLQAVGEAMHAAAARIVAKCPKDQLPHELEIVTNGVSADIPTHLFAVYSQSVSPLQKQRITLHPIHALVLAAHCRNLPFLLLSEHTTPAFSGRTVLPVIPLCIPSRTTFPILVTFLYTQRTDYLLASLIPLVPHNPTQSAEQLSHKLANTFTIPALLTHVSTTYGLWSNVAALGVFDERLWRAIDVAWTVLLGALAVSTGETWGSKAPL